MGAAERWIIAGDSIQSHVYLPGTIPSGDAALTAARLPSFVDLAIYNLSSPGAQLTDGGRVGFGLESNLNAIKYIHGYAGATGVICTLGHNDWADPSTSAQRFLDAYRALIQYCKSLGLAFVGVGPINECNGANGIQQQDGIHSLVQYQSWVVSVCQEQGVKTIAGSTCPLVPSDYADGIHLTATGHQKFCQWLIQQMKALGYWTAI